MKLSLFLLFYSLNAYSTYIPFPAPSIPYKDLEDNVSLRFGVGTPLTRNFRNKASSKLHENVKVNSSLYGGFQFKGSWGFDVYIGFGALKYEYNGPTTEREKIELHNVDLNFIRYQNLNDWLSFYFIGGPGFFTNFKTYPKKRNSGPLFTGNFGVGTEYKLFKHLELFSEYRHFFFPKGKFANNDGYVFVGSKINF